MEKDNTFFEEAAKLFNDPDSFVAETAKALYQHMLTLHTENGLSPISDFNILYFFQSVIRLRLLGSTGTSGASKEYLRTPISINAINVPKEIHEPFLKDYVSMVTADSNLAGSNFDVGYAIAIIASAIEPNLELKPIVVPPISDEDFDNYWLSGFNAGDS